jgi:hypothetical protein
MDHLRNLAISGPFKAYSEPIWMYCLQQSIHCQKEAEDSFLLLVWTTPCKFFMMLPWDSERSDSFDFTSLKQKKVHYSSIQQIGGLADHLKGTLTRNILAFFIIFNIKSVFF